MAETDICTVVWPLLSSEDPARGGVSSDVADAWIVGWNPHGLSVVVAWFLTQRSFQEAMKDLVAVKAQLKHHTPPPGLPSFQALQILGYVRGRSLGADAGVTAHSPTDHASDFFGSPVSQLPAVLRESSVRQMRQSSDIWLDLVQGPMLGEVWCCGYRVQCCQLHIVRCEPNRRLTCKPTVFSATALFGSSGIAQLRSGKRPITVPGSQSTAEGILLPDVLRRECAPRTSNGAAERLPTTPRATSKPKSSSVGSSAATPADSPVSSRHRRRHSAQLGRSAPSDLSSELSFNVSDSDGDNGQVAEKDLANLLTNQSQSFPYMSVFDATKNVTAQPGVPPRLDFPTSNDDGELSYMLRMSRPCLHVRRVIESLVKSPAQADEQRDEQGGPDAGENKPNDCLEGEANACATGSPKTTGEAPRSNQRRRRGGISAMQNMVNVLLDGVLYVLLGVLPIVSQLSRFLWTMEVLEMRLREAINLFSLLRGRTRSCGLHPCLPHIASSHRRHRLFCYMNMLTGVLIDVLLGHVLRLQLLIGGPPLHQRAQHLTRRYLYENHMSYLDWFDGWPAGLKVNEDMNKTLCFFAKMVVACWDALMRWPLDLTRWVPSAAVAPSAFFRSPLGGTLSLPPLPTLGDPSGPTEYLWIVPSYGLILTLSLFGASFSCALVADLTGIVSLHLRVLYHLVGFLYRGSKLLLRHFSLQFRGLKYNPLRNRIDTFDFATDQMLTSTLLFTTVVFLFPTIAVYYVYFACIRASIRLVQETLAVAAHFLLHVPLFPVVFWLRFRATMKKGLMLSTPRVTMRRPLQAGGAAGSTSGVAHTVDMTVLAAPLPLHYMLTDFLVSLSILVKPFLPRHAIALFVSGTADYGVGPLQELIPHLIANCVDPPCTLC